MASHLRIMSWNIQTLSSKKIKTNIPHRGTKRSHGGAKADAKGASFCDLVAKVTFTNNVDLLLIMEVSKNAELDLISGLQASLDALEPLGSGNKWKGLISKVAEKKIGLPPKIAVVGGQHPQQHNFGDYTTGKDYYFGVPEGGFYACYDCTVNDEAKVDKETVWTLKSDVPSEYVQHALNQLARAGVLSKRADPELYAAFFRYNTEDAATETFTNGSFSLVASRCSLVFTNQAGNTLGYQDIASPFNGRSPYFLCLETNETPSRFVPLLLFHAPFGDIADAEKIVRIPAIQTLMDVAVSSDGTTFVEMKNSTHGVICGDFNVGYVSSPLNEPYSFLDGKGYKATIDGVSTQGDEKYDNILLKWQPTIAPAAQGQVVDVTAVFPGLGITKGDGSSDALKNIYWSEVSDHLPVVLHVTLP